MAGRRWLSDLFGSGRRAQRLFRAAWEGDVKAVDELIQAGVDINQATNEHGPTPLFWAARRGHVDVVDRLLRAGADVDLANKNGRSPLFMASSDGHVEIVHQLLRAGADVHRVDMRGWSSVHAACYWLRHAVLRQLLPRSNALLYTADNDGYLPLHVALLQVWSYGCSDAALKTFQVLVAHGCAWDAMCEKIADQDIEWPSPGNDPPPTSDDNGRWQRESSAVHLCFRQWMLEHEHGRPLTYVPLEEVQRGVHATSTYLAAIAASTNVTFRCKVCVVGPSGWGKTSLIKSLTQEKPSLVHIDNRTIGIDHFKLKFEHKVDGLQVTKQHEVTFWDFAGQDAYQVAHSLFFSARTLYIVCIDLESFVTACMQAQLMTDNESEFNHWMNDFIEMKVLKWIRVICARQPDATFVYVVTKEDCARAVDLEDADGALSILKALLKNVEVVVYEMKNAHETQTRIQDESSVEGPTQELPISHLGDPRLHAMVKKPSVQMIVTTCVTKDAVSAFKKRIQDTIVNSNRGYPMPDKYTSVRNALLKIRATASALATEMRLQNTLVSVSDLITMLVKKVSDEYGHSDTPVEASSRTSTTKKPYLDELTCRTILHTLRDLGDVLWYDNIDDKLLQNTIVIDPMLMIDLVRQVFNHKRTAETMTHYTLKELDLWKHLEGTDGMLSMKRVLQHFQLVYPMTGEMQADSDLIVPAYWQSNTCAFWMFGGGDLRFGKGVHREDVAVRVHWEFQFVNNYPHTLFDNVVVASCSATYKRDVGPDWIMYMEKDKCACRLALKRALYSHHWIIHLEAIKGQTANDDDEEYLWSCFLLVVKSLEKVIRGYPGVVVTRYAREDTNEDVEPTRYNLKTLQQGETSQLLRRWMPPQKTWEAYLACLNN